MLVPGQTGYRDVAARELKQGAAAARAYLKKAGYRNTLATGCVDLGQGD